MTMVVGKRDIAEPNSSKIAFLLFLELTLSLAFPLPHPCFGDSECSLLPLGHQLCKFVCVYLSPGSARQSSSHNSTSEAKRQVKCFEDLKFKIKQMSFQKEEISQLLYLYTSYDLNDR